MRHWKQNRGHAGEHRSGEGPFVSFTDLLAGIVFMLLLMVALLMLRQQQAHEELEKKADPAPYLTTINELREQAKRLFQDNLDLGAAIRADKDAKRALDADFKNNPRLHAAMVFNQYSRALHAGAREFKFDHTDAIYLSEDRKQFRLVELRRGIGEDMFPDKPGTAADYARGLDLEVLSSSCRSLNREQWNWACGDGSRRSLARFGSTYVGQQTTTRDGKTGLWDIRIEVIAIYDDYFR